jgi:glycosyltransferase involved in cell wall biosynthesis
MATIRILISYLEGPVYGDPLPNKNYEFKIVNILDYDKYGVFKLVREFKPDIILSIGECVLGHLASLNHTWRKRISYFESFDKISDQVIEGCFMHSSMPNPKDDIVPLVSVVSTAYKSGDRILRPYNSLINQTYDNWEWIVYDDSEDNDDTWNRLNALYEKDYRITLIRSNKNDGNIGSVKFKASMLARGKYMVEFDHDDILHPQALQWLVDAGKTYPDAGFFYTYTCPIYEESESCLIYGEYIGFGYQGYEAVKLNGRWMYNLTASTLNPVTIQHLIGMPNHLRAFKTDLYRKIGGSNSRFSVADDYEVMIKAFLETRYVCIPEPGYIQYHNVGGNNFTYLRNSLIQLLVKYVYNHYKPQIEQKFTELGIDNDKHYHKCWEEVEKTYYPSLEHIYFPQMDSCISIILPIAETSTVSNSVDRVELETIPNLDGPMGMMDIDDEISVEELITRETLKDSLIRILKMLYNQKHVTWRLHISGSGIGYLKDVMEELKDFCGNRVRWWNMSENKDNDEITAKNYAIRLMAKSKYISYMDLNSLWNDDKLDNLLSGMSGDSSKDYFIDSDNVLIHLRDDDFNYWLPFETTEDFISRCSN